MRTEQSPVGRRETEWTVNHFVRAVCGAELYSFQVISIFDMKFSTTWLTWQKCVVPIAHKLIGRCRLLSNNQIRGY